MSNVKAAATAALSPPSASQGSQPDSTKAGGISGTELDGLFKRFPITSAQHAEQYPRAAITITSATPSIFKAGKFTDQECIRFNVRLWTGAKTSKRFDNLQMCSGDVSADVAFSPLRNWPIFYALRNTTGAVRTDGPQRPAKNFPTDQKVLDAWFERPSRGIYFIGSILYQLGYDWSQPGEDRLWFVSAPDR